MKIDPPAEKLEGGVEGSRTRNCSGDEGSKSPPSNLLGTSELPSPMHAEKTPNFKLDINAGIGKSQ